MRVLVLHSDVVPDAPPEEMDTLLTARAIADALTARGHKAVLAPFAPSLDALRATLAGTEPDVVFNMVERALGQDQLAAIAPAFLEQLGVPCTGNGAAAILATGDKPFSKQLLRGAGLATPDWCEPPHWRRLKDGARYIVKSATEDASLGLDDGAVVTGADAVKARAKASAARHGGRWFAEAFIEGREFNISVLEEGGVFTVLPMPEIRFVGWPEGKVRIVGYEAKWNDDSLESTHSVRQFGVEREEPELAAILAELSKQACVLFAVRGYARVDFRVDATGVPLILELNPNPCLDPAAGFATAAAEAGISYGDVLERILRNAC